MSEQFNGYENKATWLVKLWIDNDQGEQEYWLSEAREHLMETAAYGANAMQQAQYRLAGQLREHYDQAADDFRLGTIKLISDAHFFSDLMGWALAMVNWDEVAKSLIEDAQEVEA